MPRSFRKALLLPLLLAGWSCGPSALGPSLEVSVAATLAPDGTCSGAENPAKTSLAAAKTIRYTVHVRHASGPSPNEPLCDALVAPSALPTFKYSVTAGDRVDLFGEVFDDKNNRLASGSLLGLDGSPSSLPDLRLFETETFRCFAPPKGASPDDRKSYRLQQSRAFHTATPLPNGDLLIVGGLIASRGGTDQPTDQVTDKVFLTSTVEVYSFSSGRFTALADVSPPLAPRAFHHAFLLPDTTSGAGPFRVLLEGGITAMPQGSAVLQSNALGAMNAFRFAPSDVSPTAAPLDVLVYDPTAHTLSRGAPPKGLASTAFDAATALPNGVVASAFGASVYAAAATMLVDHLQIVKSEAAGASSGSIGMDTRFAPALVALDGATGLAIGGATDVAGMTKPFARIAFTDPPTSAPVDPMTPFPLLQFPTALLADAGPPQKVLIAGGLELSSATGANEALNPPAVDQSLWLALVNGNALSLAKIAPGAAPSGPRFVYDTSCSIPDSPTQQRFRAAAWNAATVIGKNRVLLTGGTARHVVAPACEDCPSGDNVFFCALGQGAIVDIAKQQVIPISPSGSGFEGLLIRRFGHTQTLSPDGRVVLIGGFTRRGGRSYTVAEAELFNPTRRVPLASDPDDPVAKALADRGWARDPGGQAYQVGAPGSAIASCGDPTK